MKDALTITPEFKRGLLITVAVVAAFIAGCALIDAVQAMPLYKKIASFNFSAWGMILIALLGMIPVGKLLLVALLWNFKLPVITVRVQKDNE